MTATWINPSRRKNISIIKLTLMNLRLSLHKIYKNKGFQWPIFSDFALIRENTGQWKPVFWHILYSVWNKILIIFADDTKVIRQITTKEDFIVEDMERTLQLQSEINIIAGMVSKMASYISPKKKCLVVKLSKQRNLHWEVHSSSTRARARL